MASRLVLSQVELGKNHWDAFPYLPIGNRSTRINVHTQTINECLPWKPTQSVKSWSCACKPEAPGAEINPWQAAAQWLMKSGKSTKGLLHSTSWWGKTWQTDPLPNNPLALHIFSSWFSKQGFWPESRRPWCLVIGLSSSFVYNTLEGHPQHVASKGWQLENWINSTFMKFVLSKAPTTALG